MSMRLHALQMGGQFGLGCEMGISTQKLHAWTDGTAEMTSYKYIVSGNGQEVSHESSIFRSWKYGS